jgi:hypothetical protein
MTPAPLSVTNVATRAAILQEIARRIEAADLEELLTAGIDGETIDRFRALRNGDAQHLAGACAGLFAVVVDAARFRWLLDVAEERYRASELLEYFVQHGATLAMIRVLLRPARGMVESYFANLKPLRARGRPSLPDGRCRDRIHVAWADLRKEFPALPERERLVELHRQFPSFTLATLYSVLNEFNR